MAAGLGTRGCSSGATGLQACHASRPGYQGSGRPVAARQAAECSDSIASRRAWAAASHLHCIMHHMVQSTVHYMVHYIVHYIVYYMVHSI